MTAWPALLHDVPALPCRGSIPVLPKTPALEPSCWAPIAAVVFLFISSFHPLSLCWFWHGQVPALEALAVLLLTSSPAAQHSRAPHVRAKCACMQPNMSSGATVFASNQTSNARQYTCAAFQLMVQLLYHIEPAGSFANAQQPVGEETST